jgi:hypothetical protein
LYLWSKTLLPSYILTTLGDRMEMAHSVEGRVPFLDHHLVEVIRSQPVNQKINGMTEKYVLREAVRDVVTDTVYRRQKHPFLSPPATLNPTGKLNAMVQDTLRGTALTSLPFFRSEKGGGSARPARHDGRGFTRGERSDPDDPGQRVCLAGALRPRRMIFASRRGGSRAAAVLLSGMGPEAPRLSAVLVAGLQRRRAQRVLDALAVQTVAGSIEVIVVDLGDDRLPRLAVAPALKHVYAKRPAIKRWGAARAEGVRLASADVIGFIEDHCFPDPDWAERLIEAYRDSWAAVGYAFTNANPRTFVSRASLLARYGRFVHPTHPAPRLWSPATTCRIDAHCCCRLALNSTACSPSTSTFRRC